MKFSEENTETAMRFRQKVHGELVVTEKNQRRLCERLRLRHGTLGSVIVAAFVASVMVIRQTSGGSVQRSGRIATPRVARVFRRRFAHRVAPPEAQY
jgi:hypothetical protein